MLSVNVIKQTNVETFSASAWGFCEKH